MKTRKFEKLGIETSLLGFGCMRFPTTKDGNIDEVLAEKMLDKAIANGVNYIDTAFPYHNGESEPFVGKVLKKYPRDSFYLATKLPVWEVKKEEDIERIFNNQLSRLQTDYVDFYLMHAMSKDRWDEMKKFGCVEKLEKLQKEGKIKNLGFSFHDDYSAFEEIINARDWDFCQIQLNYMDTEDQAGMKGYELAASKNIPMSIMEPVKGGSLAVLSDDIMDEFHNVDEEASAASFALRFVGTLPYVMTVLSGMSNMEQLDDNLNTFNDFKPMSDADNKAVEKVKAILKSRVQNSCTGCRYCMPCPFGVDIPECFSVWNRYHMFQNYNSVSWNWDNLVRENKLPSVCKECGKCESVCPQHLNIRQDLKRVQMDIEARKW